MLRKGARITGTARVALASNVKKRYESGESIRALADETGRSYGFIHRLLVDADVPFRARGGATRRRSSG
ncbi:MAG: helix-turn-helix domain-containing protein [Nakamurella sp.]